ncbi:MAG: signal recognition particle protein [Abditibacteriales bacterium]|nr:signal recognition particle protein [Abditibacteriales bacterium]MDW8367711.1 signal recognition particle protein [Abditibacteriales bacterium]
MLEGLSAKLQNAFAKLRGKVTLKEEDVDAAMREIRLALLEADVNFKVVREFVAQVREKAIGADVLKNLNAPQMVVKIVHEELVKLLGGEPVKMKFSSHPPTIIMMVGLQGTGKTTTCGKLATWLKSERKKPLLVATDVYRPAAVDQLKRVGEQANVPVFEMGTNVSPVEIAKQAVNHARQRGLDVVIIDTAGRLHIDEQMMREAAAIKAAVQPHETLLVVDAMTGQDAVNAATEFHNAVGVDGIILTKLDGDARGGAILSVRQVTGKPVKFVGIGEKLDALEPFYPDRMAGRILGMGDMLTLIEKAEAAIEEERAAALEKKLRHGEFDLEDFLEQIQQLKKMGPLEHLIGMIPGMSRLTGGAPLQVDEKAMARVEAMIKSMTPEERRNPDILNGSRKRRIARGSGTTPQDLNRLLSQFREMRKMIKQLGSGKMPKGFDLGGFFR